MRPRARSAARATAAVVLAAIGLFAETSTARAHEPLWGETPTIFGPGVFHPEIMFGFMKMGDASDPGGESSRELEQEYGFQYGINRWVNVRLELPAVRTDLEANVAGSAQETRITGIGDATFSAKYRFRLRQATGFQTSQALDFGWKLPTGADDRDGPDGERLMPSDQPGSGKHGVVIGYAIDRERLIDSAWASASYSHEFGGGFRRGDTLEVDAAYGRWVVRPNVAEELGINLAFGVHAEASADDWLDGDARADNHHGVAGVHFTPIITRGRNEYRVGVFVPLVRWGNEDETHFNYEVRAGWETFF